MNEKSATAAGTLVLSLNESVFVCLLLESYLYLVSEENKKTENH